MQQHGNIRVRVQASPPAALSHHRTQQRSAPAGRGRAACEHWTASPRPCFPRTETPSRQSAVAELQCSLPLLPPGLLGTHLSCCCLDCGARMSSGWLPPCYPYMAPLLRNTLIWGQHIWGCTFMSSCSRLPLQQTCRPTRCWLL